MTYGERLRQAMDRAKVSRAVLAKHLKISVQAVGQVINGDTKALDAANHNKAFLLLKCDPLWLATGVYSKPQLTVLRAEEPVPAVPVATWPFQQLDATLVRALKPDDLHRVEGAWILAAAQLGFSLSKPAAA